MERCHDLARYGVCTLLYNVYYLVLAMRLTHANCHNFFYWSTNVIFIIIVIKNYLGLRKTQIKFSLMMKGIPYSLKSSKISGWSKFAHDSNIWCLSSRYQPPIWKVKAWTSTFKFSTWQDMDGRDYIRLSRWNQIQFFLLKFTMQCFNDVLILFHKTCAHNMLLEYIRLPCSCWGLMAIRVTLVRVFSTQRLKQLEQCGISHLNAKSIASTIERMWSSNHVLVNTYCNKKKLNNKNLKS